MSGEGFFYSGPIIECTFEQLMEKSGFSREALKESVNELITAGWLMVAGVDGNGDPVKYIPMIPKSG